MKLIEYADREMLMIDLADKLAGELTNCLLTHEQASFAVPGGTTPGPIFDTLSAVDLHWDRITVMMGDERQVPADHERSNERLVRERLLVGRAAAANYVSIREEGGALPDISAHLPISVLLVGMGADMHTASLFPGSPDLAAALASEAPLMKVEAADGLEPRITLTGPILAGAMSTHVVITGAEKRAAIERAVNLPAEQAPIRTVLNTATVHWAA